MTLLFVAISVAVAVIDKNYFASILSSALAGCFFIVGRADHLNPRFIMIPFLFTMVISNAQIQIMDVNPHTLWVIAKFKVKGKEPQFKEVHISSLPDTARVMPYARRILRKHWADRRKLEKWYR